MRAERYFKPLPLEAQTLLTEGRLKEAIRAVRDAEDLSHRAARKRVDAHLAREPLLEVQIEAQRSARRRFFFWLLLVDALIVAAVIYWFFYRDVA